MSEAATPTMQPVMNNEGGSTFLDDSPGTKLVKCVLEDERPPSTAPSIQSIPFSVNEEKEQPETNSNDAFLQLLQVLTREFLGEVSLILGGKSYLLDTP